jgi:hypothetical protein
VGAYRKEGTDPVAEFFNTGIQQVKDSFHQQMGLKFEEGTNEILHNELSFFMVLELGHLGKYVKKTGNVLIA